MKQAQVFPLLHQLFCKKATQSHGNELRGWNNCNRALLLFSLCHVRLLVTPWTAVCQGSLPFTISWSFSSSLCPLNPSCHPTVSSSFVPVSSCLQSFQASGSFLMSRFTSSGQSIGASASASVPPMYIQG